MIELDASRRPDPALAAAPLFAGLEVSALGDVLACARPRRYQAGQLICQQGDPSDRVIILTRGLAEAFVTSVTEARGECVGCFHPGDVIGEIGVVTDRPRSASVVARSHTRVVEIEREDFLRLLARHPRLHQNLTHVLGERLADTNAGLREGRPAEVIVLVVGADLGRTAADVLTAGRRASPRPLAAVDLLAQPGPGDAARVLERLDQLAATHRLVVLTVRHDDPALAKFVEHADRILALVAPPEADTLGAALAPASASADLALCFATASPILAGSDCRIVRRCAARPSPRDVTWLGRHLTRTKLGLALGAGGAKSFAHAGVVGALEHAGYEIDYLAGSSMGAVVAVWRAIGMTATEIAATLQERFVPDAVVDAVFRKGAAGAGVETFTQIFRETTGNRSFADLTIPATVMTADLARQCPAPLTDGPLWEALVAALSVPGLYPPYTRGAQRLVDAVSLIPVPLDAVVEAGADVTVAVNLLGRHTLPAWPDQGPERSPVRPRQRGVRDTVFEVLELAQLDASARQTAAADVPITPRFGPASWRQMDLGPRFLEAGRRAGEAALPRLAVLARPHAA
jgi:NTE family protein